MNVKCSASYCEYALVLLISIVATSSSYGSDDAAAMTRKCRALLRKKITLASQDETLDNFAEKFGAAVGLPVRVDHGALDAGAEHNPSILFSAREMPAESVLAHALHDAGLTWHYEDGGIVLTTLEGDEGFQQAFRYRLADFGLGSASDAFVSEIPALVMSFVGGDSWEGTGASTTRDGEQLVVNQTCRNQGAVEDFLVLLGAAFRATGDDVVPFRTMSEGEKRIHTELDRPAPLAAASGQLSGLLRSISTRRGVEIMLDRVSVADARLAEDIPWSKSVELKVPNQGMLSVRETVEQLLAPFELSYAIQHDVLLITLPQRTEWEPVIVIYYMGKLRGKGESVSQLVTSQVSRDNWEEVGGYARITAFEPGNCLIVAGSEHLQRQVELLLRRQAADSN